MTLVLLALLLNTAPLLLSAQRDAFNRSLHAAKHGDASAQNDVGIAYAEGQGVRRDQKKAVYWFRKSAAQGNALGTCNLGLNYQNGWGVKRDPILMMKYVFAANALDGLKCNPADFNYSTKPKPTECQIEKGSDLAVAWLRAHLDFKNDHDERPWLGDGKYAITVREQGGSVQLPRKRTKRCR
jgi:TPR repeat protein